LTIGVQMPTHVQGIALLLEARPLLFKRLIFVPLALMVVAGVACGKAGSPEVAAPPVGLSKVEYIAQGDAICAESDRKTDAIPQPSENASRQELVAYLQQLLTTSRPDMERFQALQAPVEDRATTDQLDAYVASMLAKLGDSLRAMTLSDRTAFMVAMEQADAVSLQFNRMAASYGFVECPKQ
jgi:hypothetical protein